ncbi:MAG: 30S ribosomal protein S8 [Planctomycetota bacterium]|jgi:small subunit ribosomal protein S8
MSMTDQIADMLTRIRNANRIARPSVSMPSSKSKIGIAEALKREGYIQEFSVSDEGAVNPTLTLQLKFGPEGEKVIQKITRESKPGCRVYVGVGDIPQVLNGLGISVLSTSKGILSGREAAEQRVGGELLCTVY